MAVELGCPWCEAEVGVDLTDLALRTVTCPECMTTHDLAPEPDSVALPLAA